MCLITGIMRTIDDSCRIMSFIHFIVRDSLILFVLYNQWYYTFKHNKKLNTDTFVAY